MKIASLPVLLLCLLILVMVLFFLSLSLSVSKHHNIFLNTYESIVVKRSPRVAVFFMFNVIIITIFRGNLKPSTEDTDNWLLSFLGHLVYELEEAATSKDETTRAEDYDEASDVDHEYDHGYDGYDEDNDDDGGEDDSFNSDDEEDKDLERRVEEFIAKNYRQRREELIYERLATCMAVTE